MNATPHDDQLIGAYVIGALDPGERAAVEAHLAACAPCRAELVELSEVEKVIAGLPPEAFAQIAPDADLALQRTLRQLRAEARAGARRRHALVAAAAAVVLAAAVGVGAALGPGGAPDGPPVAVPPSPTASTPAAGTRVGTVADPRTGVRLTASVVPAAGWVRVNASVNGIAAGEDCRLYVVDSAGRREVAAGWVVSRAAATEGTNLDGSASMPPDRIAAVEVTNTAGVVYATLRL